jgi:hypothetical protein
MNKKFSFLPLEDVMQVAHKISRKQNPKLLTQL